MNVFDAPSLGGPLYGEDLGLACPSCGEHNLHHTDVRVYDRGDDALTVRLTEVLECSVVVREELASVGCPSPRRDGLIIGFWCELCDPSDRLNLLIYQHKGTTYLRWERGERVPEVTEQPGDLGAKVS